jgi:ribosomal-protein-alanine N-acetyltransferase
MMLAFRSGQAHAIFPATIDHADAIADLHDSLFPAGWSAEEISHLLKTSTTVCFVTGKANRATDVQKYSHPLLYFIVFASLFAKNRVHFLARCSRRHISGFILCRVVADEAEILTFGVDRVMQRHGLGARLLDAAILGARDKGAKSLFLEVDEANMPALKLYRRRGFVNVGIRPAYSRRDDKSYGTALVMRLDLL